jgi:hypothetical protein
MSTLQNEDYQAGRKAGREAAEGFEGVLTHTITPPSGKSGMWRSGWRLGFAGVRRDLKLSLPYPTPLDISYSESSRWCQEHGHTGLLVGSVCTKCDQLVIRDPRFAYVLGKLHNADGSRGPEDRYSGMRRDNPAP